MKARVIVADDHLLIRAGLIQFLERGDAFEIVGEAEDGEQVVEACREQEADLVLMDVCMPQMDGIQATRAIKALKPDLKVIGLSMHLNRRFAERMIDAGASGYVMKDRVAHELQDAIDCASRGDVFLSPRLGEKQIPSLLGDLASRATAKAQAIVG